MSESELHSAFVCELHSAFVWDCDECGTENFERAIEGNLDEAAIAYAMPANHFVALDAEDGEDGMMEASQLVHKIAVAPAFVECKECKATFPTSIHIDESSE